MTAARRGLLLEFIVLGLAGESRCLKALRRFRRDGVKTQGLQKGQGKVQLLCTDAGHGEASAQRSHHRRRAKLWTSIMS
eukprot:CAMPEP_0203886326 /NCGR_PEP_ID=MMETSP0359-20131031/30156_1 /ASSEMBLY_ACC=CAM_ASM_000338 /TAXON_ID=268821 /ORGANISM="Scrippsiella Hangoei, Strain SHTV-5" /LENGTH=78 /DNA_ID=CAMNT_0050807133 /DNA_START=1 /DNA_END=234 /DNA_ORIENTATION=+